MATLFVTPEHGALLHEVMDMPAKCDSKCSSSARHAALAV